MAACDKKGGKEWRVGLCLATCWWVHVPKSALETRKLVTTTTLATVKPPLKQLPMPLPLLVDKHYYKLQYFYTVAGRLESSNSDS